MMDSLDRLDWKQSKGSKPRCHWVTHGVRSQVAARLTRLMEPWGTVSEEDRWIPDGFMDGGEAQLHEAAALLGPAAASDYEQWWFDVVKVNSQKSPNLDIVSTCQVEGRLGIEMVEGKAHRGELTAERKGKVLPIATSRDGHRNHERIGASIEAASRGFTEQTGLSWSLSRDNRYQMSSRFAAAYRFAELGYPVALIYLGFLNANEAQHLGYPFQSHEHWEDLVRSESQSLFPDEVWGKRWTIHGQPFIALIESVEIPYNRPIEAFDIHFAA